MPGLQGTGDGVLRLPLEAGASLDHERLEEEIRDAGYEPPR